MMTTRSLRLALLCTSLVAGCGVGPAPYQPDEHGGQAGGVGGPLCPDPTMDCTNSQGNGKGVYYDEDGYAGFTEPTQVLITHFINGTKTVAFDGVYYNPVDSKWLPLPPNAGHVVGADFAGQGGYAVYNISESGTDLTVTLFDPVTNTPRAISQNDLRLLTLRLRLTNPNDSKQFTNYLVRFTDSVSDKGVTAYHLEWQVAGLTSWVSYCTDHKGYADRAVFQHGVYVNPWTGKVTRNATTESSYVTMSCRLGAPATCATWGYDALQNTELFAGCIQMKRASYCGDENAYTISGTFIGISDYQGIKADGFDDGSIEANWTGNGATCIKHQRHPELGFSGACNGVPIPVCDVNHLPADHLVSSLSAKQ